MHRILVVDDQPAFRAAVKKILRAHYDVMEAGDGDEALRCQRATPADLVLTDMYMPTADGVDVIARFTSEFPEVPIVAISGGGHLDQIDVLAVARRLGARAAVPKPVSRDKLLAVVREVLGSDGV